MTGPIPDERQVGAGGPAPGLAVHEELGRGAHAVVYRARRFGVDYALKVLHESVFPDTSAVTAFRREAALLACVDHPGVVDVHEVGQARGRPYLVMELVEGQTLAEVLLGGSVDEARTVAIATDVADALAAGHRAGLTHRDIKPHNIMILSDGRAKLIDFGLAVRTAATVAEGEIAGTFSYSAPEQTGMLKRLVDGRSDLYSLGVVLFRCVTGRLPFLATDVGELLRQHTVETPPDVRQLRPELSAAFAAMVAKLLAKDPDDRYQTGEGLVADLRALAAGSLRPEALGGADAPAGTLETPLVGRTAELAELIGRWSRAQAGQGGIALVAGPPGGGKSRLVRELIATVGAEGQLTLHAKCSPDDPVPMSPVRAAVERYLAELDYLPPAERDVALDRVRAAAGRGASLLGALSPVLAAVLSAPELPDEDRQDQFAVAVATFLVGLATRAGGGVLCLDDVQWLDAGTRRVLHHLTAELTDSPLLVVATARDDAASRDAYRAFQAEFDALTDTSLVLQPLDDAAMTQLIGAHLGGAALTPGLSAALVPRIGGNPFTADEYVRALIDAGLIRPSWGTWVLEEGGLDGLDLPDNVLDLILARVTGLGKQTRVLLVAAAALGIRVRPADLARIRRVDERLVLSVLRLATDRRLMASDRNGEYTFLHDRIREALLADLDDDGQRALHLRIAQALDEMHAGDPEYIYAIARHYQRADLTRAPAQAYRAGLAAGRLALANHAPHQTLEFLRTAEAAAAAGGIATDIGFHETYGVAGVRVGRSVEARAHLHQALAMETNPTKRAMLRALISESHHSDWELSEALRAADRALAEIGRALPRHPVALIASTFAMFLVSLAVSWTGIGRGTATGATRERLRIETWALATAAHAAGSSRQMLLTACLAFRQMYPANRIGPSQEYVYAHAHLAAVAMMTGLRRLADRMFRRVSSVANRLADPRPVAYVDFVSTVIECTLRNSKVDGNAGLRRLLTERGRWLNAQESFNAAAILCNQLIHEGHIISALAWHDRVRARTHLVRPGVSHPFSHAHATARAVNGPGEEADRQLEASRAFLAAHPDNGEELVGYVMAALMSTVEQGQLGEPFERAVRALAAARLSPRNTWPAQHQIWVSLAYGRLAQWLTAPEQEHALRRDAARRAVREMRRAAKTPLNKAHYLVIQASYHQLAGVPGKALKLLERADRRAWSLDAPVIGYEVARVRARALLALGNPSKARQHAMTALHLAVDGGWEHRARAVRAEFGLDDAGFHHSSGGQIVSAEVYRRRLDALQQVSLAAATVVEPRALARVALRETIGILRAERAFLFLVDADTGQLRPQLGCDAAGTELDELTEYGASLVARVRDSGEPLVVTGTDDGETHGSRSAQVHGLRSIIIAPLRLKGRLLGVVYLDSRVAKGIFTLDDVGILMAITNHVAVSLETARAAQLEVAVEAARQQRDLAELLRSGMSQLNTTLDPDEVLDRLLAAVSRALAGEVACLLRRDGDAFTVAAVRGRVPDGVVGNQVGRDAHDTLVALAGLSAPALGVPAAGQVSPPPDLLPGARSWLAVPLAARGTGLGILLVGSSTVGAFTDAHLQIADALASQGMTAYDNARLFEQVNQLATVDPLTGVPNRRHFLDLADRAFAGAEPADHPAPAADAPIRSLTAMMLDIDHFKRVNDTYGHLVGDEVIREVGARLRAAIRDGDMLGRYGGEEFVIIVAAEPNYADGLAERLRKVVAATPVITAAGPLSVTVSIGTARRRYGDADLSVLMHRADQALYQAKERGRNRVWSADR